MRTLFYQCVSSRCSCQLNTVVSSHPFISKRASRAKRMLKGLRTAEYWLGSDPGLSSVKRMWEILVCGLKRTASVNVHVRYVSESYWPSRLISQRGRIESGHLHIHAYVSSLYLHGNHGRKKWGGSIAKSIKIDGMNRDLVFTEPSSIRHRKYPVKLAFG